ncbi:hypothetical protein [Endozoicomonas arenosclerae]|uniref:hypothetical protein n=1 Tax=Endozoicomonas arenosclerae TaxID=1633495 RepID=UPI000A50F0E2|nr:hypothetical protein [Endozoicomonas arenosclerae]
MSGTKRIGLIVRGKRSLDHNPGVMEQHADCIISTGEPFGFFGDEGAASGGRYSISWNRSGMNMKGMVANYEGMRKIRPYYVDASMAKKYNVVSCLLSLKVTPQESDLFDKFWKQLQLNPGSFNLLGGNCSSHASEAFVEANILSKGIPGLDTPNNLFKQLSQEKSRDVQFVTGHIGVRRTADLRFKLEVLPVSEV